MIRAAVILTDFFLTERIKTKALYKVILKKVVTDHLDKTLRVDMSLLLPGSPKASLIRSCLAKQVGHLSSRSIDYSLKPSVTRATLNRSSD